VMESQYASMTKRMKECIEAGGRSTRF